MTPCAGLRLQQLEQPLEGGDYSQHQGLKPRNAMLGYPYSACEIWVGFFVFFFVPCPQPGESFLSHDGQLWKRQCRAGVQLALTFKGS